MRKSDILIKEYKEKLLKDQIDDHKSIEYYNDQINHLCKKISARNSILNKLDELNDE